MDTNIYVKLKRPEGYEDVHPDLVIEDSGVKAEFEPEAVDIAALIAERDQLALERGALLQRVVELEGAARWVSVDERLPVPGAKVLAVFFYPSGKWQVVRAMHAPHLKLNTEDWGDFEPDGGEYDEATDATYWPEGWYESNEFEETHWALEHEPTHWMALPSPPAPKTEAQA